MPRRRRIVQRLAFTLLELILALALAVVILGAIGMAIDIHLRTLEKRRTYVEEGQLARAVIRRMTSDLIGAVQYQVIDFSGVPGGKEVAQAAATALTGSSETGDLAGQLADAAAATDPTATDPTATDPTATDPMATDAAADMSSSIAGTLAPKKTPGIYGNQYELMIDVSRLPRIEEYQYEILPQMGEQVLDIPTDIKTVAYFLAPDTTGESDMTDIAATERIRTVGYAGRGLVRRQLDRAVSMYATQMGFQELAEEGEMLAPEVTGLEFSYFDGTSWLMEWDSESRKGLPMAVSIAIEIDSTALDGKVMKQPTGFMPVAGDLTSSMNPNRQWYRMVVHLPSAEPTVAGEDRTESKTQGEEEGAASALPMQASQGQGAQGGGGRGG